MSADLSPTVHLFPTPVCGSRSYFMQSAGELNVKGVGASHGGCQLQGVSSGILLS